MDYATPEFDYDIKDRKGSENLVTGYLSRVMTSNASEPLICDHCSNEKLFKAHVELWFADLVTYLVTEEVPKSLNTDDKACIFQWSSFLYRMIGTYLNTVQTKSLEDALPTILSFYHNQSYGGHFSGRKTVMKILQS